MYVRQQTMSQWGPFKRPTSQKITPLVRFYEKSAEKEYQDIPKKPELAMPDLLETQVSLEEANEFMKEYFDESSDEDEEPVVQENQVSKEQLQVVYESENDELEYNQEAPFLENLSMVKSMTSPTLSTHNESHENQVTGETDKPKRSRSWIHLPVQKILASPPVQNLSFLLSKKYHSAAENVLRLQSNLQNHLLQLHPHKPDSLKSGVVPEKIPDLNVQTDVQTDGIKSTDNNTQSVVIQPTSVKSTGSTSIHSTSIQSTGADINKMYSAPKKIMHCRVMEIINTGSDRECEYEMSVLYDGTEKAFHKNQLNRTDKKTSVDRPQEEAMRLEIQDKFSLTFKVKARYTNTRFKHGLAKMGLWSPSPQNASIRKKEYQDSPVSQKKSSGSGFYSGYATLNFETKEDLEDLGVTRFKLIRLNERKGSSDAFNIELVVDIRFTKEIQKVAKKFPWAHNFENSVLPASESLNNSKMIQNPAKVALSQKHCSQGDYLTIYTRGSAHPVWKRYWAVMEENRLALYDFTYKTIKAPAHLVSMQPLLSVSKPSMDDCENVGIARKVGIALQFDKQKAFIGEEDVRFDDGEVLEGKAFVYCDDETKSDHWRRALVAYTANENHKLDGDIDLRFLW